MKNGSLMKVESIAECSPFTELLHLNKTVQIDMKKGAFVKYSKTCLKRHSKKHKTKVLMENVSLMKIESISEFSPWSILQYF